MTEVPELPELVRIDGGYRVKTRDGFHLDVRPMVKFFRLIEVSEASRHVIGRYWCYESFTAAVLAAHAWEASPDTEPVGWFRCGGARPDQ